MEKNTHILIVGCGGIGTEIIKICALRKQLRLTLIDFDRVEYSNLNRQFLFSKNHVGNYKVEALRDFYLSLVPDAEVTIITESIIADKYDINFFISFPLIFNCLDNMDARKFVSRRFLLMRRYFENRSILIDGGSGGFFGQARYFSGKNCYDCLNFKSEDAIPTVCTIRSVPTTFNHCVLWAAEQEEEVHKRLKNSLTKMERIHLLAVERAAEYGIEKENIFFSESLLKNVIPTLASTNAIIASLMILSLEQQYNTILTADGVYGMVPDEKSIDCKYCTLPTIIIFVNEYFDYDEIIDYFSSEEQLNFIDEFNNLIINIEKNFVHNRFYILNSKFIVYFIHGDEFDIRDL